MSDLLIKGETEVLKVRLAEIEKAVGQHLGQLYASLDTMVKALEAIDARITQLEPEPEGNTVGVPVREGKEL